MDVDVIIDQAYDGIPQRREIGAISGIMVHRVGVDLKTGAVIGYDAPSIVDAFIGKVPQWKSVAAATGGQNAYTFYIGGDLGPKKFEGKIWQALPFDEVGHHARRFSVPYMGVALIGDFRAKPPSKIQWLRAVDLISDICMLLDLDVAEVVGHGDVKGAHGGEKAPGQPFACPGGFLSMGELRRAVESKIKRWARHSSFWRLHRSGVQLI